VIGKTPFGFGSSSPRFPKERKDSTPGPGSYDPKPIAKQAKGRSFSKASRFDEQKVSRGASLSHNGAHVDPKPMSELDIVQQVKQKRGMQKALETAVSFPRRLGQNRQVAAVVIDSKGTVSKACSGQNAQATTEHTRFRIGSLSKFVTGVAVKRLEGTEFVTKLGDHSQLSGSTKLSEVFSQDELIAMFGLNHQRGGRLTVQQLMDQRSGIRSQQESDEDKNLDRQVSDLSVAELGEPTTSELLRACAAGLNLGFKFPETSGDCPFNYTNFNATLIGAVLERVCEKPFQEIMQDALFNPLGMTETGYSTPIEEQRASSFKNGVVSKNDFLRNEDPDANLYESLIEEGILKQVNETEAKLTKSVEALIIECSKNSIEVPDSILDILRQAQNGGFHAWEQEEYNDSHFFDASSHIWTSAHDLTLLFQHLRTDSTFTEYFQALMQTDRGQNYHAFAKTRVEDGVFSFGHDGGRDDFGSAVHMDSKARVMIWLENANVAEVDGSSQLATGLLEMTPFHGDPTRIKSNEDRKIIADMLTSSLTRYCDHPGITWLHQTSRGDGVIRDRHSLSNTDFGKWALSDNEDSLPKDGTYSCYEIILKAGFENGLITHEQISKLYQPDTQSSCKWMDEVLCKDKTVLTHINPSPEQERPKAGDLILFGDNTRATSAEQRPSANVHVVTALGNEEGPVRVLSHHRKGQPPVILTLEELMLEMPGLSGQEMLFSEPQWPI